MAKPDRYATIRTDTVIGGDKDVVLLRAPISTAQTTVITPWRALQLAGDKPERGPCRCTSSALGEYCGQTIAVSIDLPKSGCRQVKVNAIVAPIPAAIGDVIVGCDVLRAAKPVLSFQSRRSIRVSCRRQVRR